MSQFANSTGIPVNGLKLYVDMYNKNSYIGAPVTNLGWATNPRIDTSYTRRNYNPGGTYSQFHADAINVYNTAGTDITVYDNSGVTDWTNTRHAKWTFDGDLGKPVVTMQNITDGSSWKAKTWGMPASDWASNGLPNVGDRYTISWLQWVDNLSLTADCGLYYYNTSAGYNNFWDGSARNQGTAYNTKLRTWQRVYATFTRGANSGTISGWYCYGMNTGTGTIKMADIQVNAGANALYTGKQTLGVTESVKDLTGNNTLTVSNLVHSYTTYSFNGSSSYIDCGNNFNLQQAGQITMAAWVRPVSSSGLGNIMSKNANTGYRFRIQNGELWWYVSGVAASGGSVPNGSWAYCVVTGDSSGLKAYVNGTLVGSNSTAYAPTSATAGNLYIGCYAPAQEHFNGDIATAALYNRALTATEVLQTYQATKGRFGL